MTFSSSVKTVFFTITFFIGCYATTSWFNSKILYFLKSSRWVSLSQDFRFKQILLKFCSFVVILKFSCQMFICLKYAVDIWFYNLPKYFYFHCKITFVKFSYYYLNLSLFNFIYLFVFLGQEDKSDKYSVVCLGRFFIWRRYQNFVFFLSWIPELKISIYFLSGFAQVCRDRFDSSDLVAFIINLKLD